MSAKQTVAPYVFIIDTDQYSGNFERELCAFLTGSVGECGVGDGEQALFKENGQFQDLADKTSFQPDDNGCSRPATIWETGKVGVYKSVAIFFDSMPSPEEVAFMKQRAKEFIDVHLANVRRYNKKAKPLTIEGFRMIRQEVRSYEEYV